MYVTWADEPIEVRLQKAVRPKRLSRLRLRAAMFPKKTDAHKTTMAQQRCLKNDIGNFPIQSYLSHV